MPLGGENGDRKISLKLLGLICNKKSRPAWMSGWTALGHFFDQGACHKILSLVNGYLDLSFQVDQLPEQCVNCGNDF